jgi:hypothetical protein
MHHVLQYPDLSGMNPTSFKININIFVSNISLHKVCANLEPCVIYSHEVHHSSFTFILILLFEIISLYKLCAVLEPCLLSLCGLSQTSTNTENTSWRFQNKKNLVQCFYSYANNFHRNYYTKCVRLSRWIVILTDNRKKYTLYQSKNLQGCSIINHQFYTDLFHMCSAYQEAQLNNFRGDIFFLIEILWHRAPQVFLSLSIE